MAIANELYASVNPNILFIVSVFGCSTPTVKLHFTTNERIRTKTWHRLWISGMKESCVSSQVYFTTTKSSNYCTSSQWKIVTIFSWLFVEGLSSPFKFSIFFFLLKSIDPLWKKQNISKLNGPYRQLHTTYVWRLVKTFFSLNLWQYWVQIGQCPGIWNLTFLIEFRFWTKSSFDYFVIHIMIWLNRE